jgi:hypothetical protein
VQKDFCNKICQEPTCANLGEAVSGGVAFANDCHSRDAWPDLFEKLQPFPADIVFVWGKSGGVAARPRSAIDEAGSDRVSDDRKHNRHCAGRL